MGRWLTGSSPTKTYFMHSLARLRAEREFALAAAAREIGFEADAQSIIAARLGAVTLPRGHVQLGDLDDCARRWAPIAQRKGPAELRALVAKWAPVRSVHGGDQAGQWIVGAGSMRAV